MFWCLPKVDHVIKSCKEPFGWTECVYLKPQKRTCTSSPTMELRLVFFTSDASLTFVDISPLAETITNLQVVCCFLCFQLWFELWKCQRDFFDRRSKKNGANIAMASRFWLAAYIAWMSDPLRKLHHNARQSNNKKMPCLKLQYANEF